MSTVVGFLGSLPVITQIMWASAGVLSVIGIVIYWARWIERR